MPTVLLTLLSIIQALSLEFLWSHMKESPYLFEMSWDACLYWIQIGATFLGIVQIWIVYSSNALRFRWVPRTSDSIFPFLVGLFEFALIESLGPGNLGWWFGSFGILFALITWIDHSIMRHARNDGSNSIFFDQFEPATIRDFYPAIVIFIVVETVAVLLLMNGGGGAFTLLALLGATMLMLWFIRTSSMYWNRSVSEKLAECD
ncbi:MAG: hypothetical protein HKN77_05425 [Woeseiaceae bacterium]|nr:hypothetical protein [Woeseiaceae bacterium]